MEYVVEHYEKEYYLRTQDGVIVEADKKLIRFIGEHLGELVRWIVYKEDFSLKPKYNHDLPRIS